MSKLTPHDITERVRCALRERSDIDEEVALNRDFARGKQWGDWDRQKRDQNRFTSVNMRRTKEWRPVHNHFEKVRMQRLAKYNEMPPKYSCVPATNRVSDIDAGKAGQRYLDFWVESRRLKSKLLEAYNYMTVDGTAWLYFHVAGGSDTVSVIPYHQLLVQPGVSDHQRADWIILLQTMSLSEAKEYAKSIGASQKKIEPSHYGWLENTDMPLDLESYGYDSRNAFGNHGDPDEARVVVFEHHDRDGTVTVATDKEILLRYDSLKYYPDLSDGRAVGGMRYRFFKIVEKAVPGQMYGESMAAQMRDPQVNINRAIGLTLDYMERFANPPLVIPQGSVQDTEQFTGEPGQMIEVNPIMGEPHFMNMPPPPAHLFSIVSELETEAQSITLTPDSMSGNLPGGENVSGRTLAILEASSQNAIAITTLGLRDVLSDLGYTILRYAKFIHDELGQPIMFKVLGDSRAWEAHAFLTSDLEEGFTVLCDFGSALEQNAGLRHQSVMEMFGAGLITNPENGAPDAERALKMIGHQSLVHLYGEESIERARNEFYMMSQAQTPEDYISPLPFEDHQKHLKTHEADLRRPEFYELQKKNPDGYQMCIQHFMHTQQIIQQEEQARLMASHQQIAGGASPNAASGGKPQPGSSPFAPAGGPGGNPVQQADQMAQNMAAPIVNEATDNSGAQQAMPHARPRNGGPQG